MTAPPDQHVPSRPLSGSGRVAQASAPTERVSLDWWQQPSIAPTSSLVVEHIEDHLLELGEVARSWPTRNVMAQLVAEPSNPRDRQAVMVLLDGYRVGYLPARRDPRYTAIVKHLARTQGPVRVRARVLGDADHPSGVVVDGYPECFDPRRHFCAGTRDLVAVTTPEHRHLIEDVADEPAPVSARLSTTISTPDEMVVVTVALDGIVVGRLSDEHAREYAGLVRAAIARDVEPTCTATMVRSSDGGTALHLALADEPSRFADVCD